MQTQLLHRVAHFSGSNSRLPPPSSGSLEHRTMQQQQQQQPPLAYASYASTPNSPSFTSSSPSFSASSGYYPSFPRTESMSSVPFFPSGGDELFPAFLDAPSSPPCGPLSSSSDFPYQQQPNPAPQLMPSLSATAFSSMAMNVPYPSPFSPSRSAFNGAPPSSAPPPPAAAHSIRQPMSVPGAEAAYGLRFKREPLAEYGEQEEQEDAVMQPIAVRAPTAPTALRSRGLALDEAEVNSPVSAPYTLSARYGLRAPHDDYVQYRSASTMSTASADSSPMPATVAVSPPRLNPSLLLAPLDSGGGVHRKSSCLLCHRAKTSCDGRRPCDRCIRLDRQHLCVEREKARGRGKQAGKKRKVSEAEQRDGAAAAAEDKDEDDKEDDADHDHSSTADESRDSGSPHPADSALPAQSTLALSSSAPPPPPPASSPSSASSFSAPLPSAQEELVNVDDRELSSTMLRVLQSDQVSVSSFIQQTSHRKNIPTQAMQALISYIGSSLHPDDYRTFMSQLDADHRKAEQAADGAAAAAGSGSSSSSSNSIDISDRMFIRLPDGRVMPRVLFTFRRSGFEALPDCDRLVNIAMLTVYRAPPAAQTAGQKQQLQSSSSAATAEPQAAQAIKKEQQEATAAPAVLSPGGAGNGETTQRSPAPQQPDESAASASSASSSESPSAAGGWVPEPVPGANFARLSEVDLVVQVNREFERLFNYSQREMRDLLCREGSKGLYRLYTPASLLLLGRWLAEACMGVRTEFRAVVTIVNKYRGATAVVLTARFILDPHGFFSSVCYAYTPLPDGLQPKRRDNSDGAD